MIDNETLVATHLAEGAATIKTMISKTMDEIIAAGELVSQAIIAGNKVLFCGNGGSAADAQHIAAELMGRFMAERGPIAAIALTTDTSMLTAWTNDKGFETLYSRQVEGLGKAGDVLVAISTSGNSPNIIAAVEKAHELRMGVVMFTGETGGKLIQHVTSLDVAIRVPSSDTQHIQEGHITVGHIICALVEQAVLAARS